MGYPRAGYEISEISDLIELGEDHLRYLLEQVWDKGYEAGFFQTTDHNPYQKED